MNQLVYTIHSFRSYVIIADGRECDSDIIAALSV